MKAVAGALLAALLAGCARAAWMADESDRIDQVMKRDRFCEHVDGAAGVAVEGAPPIAPPPAADETYRLRSERDRRISSSRAQSTPRARAKGRAATRGAVQSLLVR